MTLSIEAVLSTLTVAVLASIGAYIGTIRWIAKIDKNKVSHDVCSRHRMNCPCLSDIVELKGMVGYKKGERKDEICIPRCNFYSDFSA